MPGGRWSLTVVVKDGHGGAPKAGGEVVEGRRGGGECGGVGLGGGCRQARAATPVQINRKVILKVCFMEMVAVFVIVITTAMMVVVVMMAMMVVVVVVAVSILDGAIYRCNHYCIYHSCYHCRCFRRRYLPPPPRSDGGNARLSSSFLVFSHD